MIKRYEKEKTVYIRLIEIIQELKIERCDGYIDYRKALRVLNSIFDISEKIIFYPWWSCNANDFYLTVKDALLFVSCIKAEPKYKMTVISGILNDNETTEPIRTHIIIPQNIFTKKFQNK